MAYQELQMEEGAAQADAVASTSAGEVQVAEAAPEAGRFARTIAPLVLAGAAVLAVGGYGLAHLANGRPLVVARTGSTAMLATKDALDGTLPAGRDEGVKNTRRKPSIKPFEHKHDHNTCDDSEELYAGLCYTKCSVLTGFSAAHRVSAFTCCPTPDCHGNVFKMKTSSLVPCQGYDVSSADMGKACPHEEGACLKDEEQFLGECFETCDKLTEGKFPKRIAAATCCNPDAEGGCLNLGNDRTKSALNVGGGGGDGDASTPAEAHMPLKSLTESS
eukprot:TRINITY_DN2705_c0_g2_i1.p1 TRINITY_DN2705_c0_g2~~TRINITY_DN2705_c0_g2_i1.p1  ORF type:complete len:297 (-),score=68.63 TRINITY_DN2705_c0_g2_i1:291-1115(-)